MDKWGWYAPGTFQMGSVSLRRWQSSFTGQRLWPDVPCVPYAFPLCIWIQGTFRMIWQWVFELGWFLGSVNSTVDIRRRESDDSAILFVGQPVPEHKQMKCFQRVPGKGICLKRRYAREEKWCLIGWYGKAKFLLPQPKEFSDSKDKFLFHLSMNALGIRFCLAVAVTANCPAQC